MSHWYKTMTEGLLARGIAYELQVRQLGGLTPAEKKALGARAQGRSNPNPATLKAGTRLYRSWRGVTQEVLVLERGYSWRGKRYASLSEVSRLRSGGFAIGLESTAGRKAYRLAPGEA